MIDPVCILSKEEGNKGREDARDSMKEEFRSSRNEEMRNRNEPGSL
jgi:hypothetical protein